MGQSGTGAHGIHLHLECATTQAWDCSTFVNPSTQLGIPNVSGTVVIYDGSVPPIPPVPPVDYYKKGWKWIYGKNKNINLTY